MASSANTRVLLQEIDDGFPPTMNPSDLEQASVRRNFERAAGGYEQHAVLQREVETRLLERVEHFAEPASRVLDLGCGPGSAGASLAGKYPDAQIIGLDCSAGMLGNLRSQTGNQAVCADMQALPFAARNVDLVFSSLALHWASDPRHLFEEVCRALRPGGLFLFSTLGPETLYELRAAWQTVDDQPHVHGFMDMHDLGDLLVAAGFRDPVMDREHIVLEYREVLTLMRDLKSAGAGNSAHGRHRGLTGRGRLQAMLDSYETYRVNDRYPASFEVVFGVARAPEEGQPMRTPEGEMAVFSVDELRGSRPG
jgi:malonyl-CoA O-methyltransferase